MSKIDHISNTYQYGAVLITVISLFLTVTEKSFPFPKIETKLPLVTRPIK